MKKRRFWRELLAFGIVLTLGAGSSMTALAEESAGNEETARTYQITYRPGQVGRFTESWFEELEAFCERHDYSAPQKSEATGNISVTLPARAEYPSAPTAEDVELGENEGRYYFKGWKDQAPVEAVEGDADFVAAYGALKNGVEYQIRYVDAVSGAEVAVPVISVGSLGEAVSATAKMVPDYVYDAAQKTLTLGADAGQNVLEFRYTSTLEPVINETVTTEAGDVIVQQIGAEGVQEPAGEAEETAAPAAGEPAGGGAATGAAPEAAAGGDEAAGGLTEAPDEPVPQAGGDEAEQEDTQAENEEVPDEEVPLVNADRGTPPLLTVTLAGGGVLLLAAAVFLYKKKRKVQES